MYAAPLSPNSVPAVPSTERSGYLEGVHKEDIMKTRSKIRAGGGFWGD